MSNLFFKKRVSGGIATQCENSRFARRKKENKRKFGKRKNKRALLSSAKVMDAILSDTERKDLKIHASLSYSGLLVFYDYCTLFLVAPPFCSYIFASPL